MKLRPDERNMLATSLSPNGRCDPSPPGEEPFDSKSRHRNHQDWPPEPLEVVCQPTAKREHEAGQHEG